MPKPLTQAQLKDDILKAAEQTSKALCKAVENKMDERHTENTGKLDSIVEAVKKLSDDAVAAKVKMDSLYGNGTGRKGAIERIEEKLADLSGKMMWAWGLGFAFMLVIGWLLHK